jgi:hypothetical protein
MQIKLSAEALDVAVNPAPRFWRITALALALSWTLADGAAAGLGCPAFPPNNPWNQRIDSLPIHPRSADYVESIGEDGFLRAAFGTDGRYGIPYNIVGASTPRVEVEFVGHPAESDPGPYPVPNNPRIEGAGSPDRHLLLVDKDACKLFELYLAEKTKSGWRADSGAIFDLLSNSYRPAGWTSADAAGLPIFPGLVRYEEVVDGQIRHALRFTVRQSQKAYIHPARHWASTSTNPRLPPMGLRLRLKAGYDTSWIDGQASVVATALKRYGMFVADNGHSWYLFGAPNPRWNDRDLAQLNGIPAAAFEAVNTGPIVTPPVKP